MSTPKTESLHETRARAIESLRREAARRLRHGGDVNPFYLEGRLAHGRGEPLARNESDPWRSGWLAAAAEARYNRGTGSLARV